MVLDLVTLTTLLRFFTLKHLRADLFIIIEIEIGINVVNTANF
jgi:hypothetical protein